MRTDKCQLYLINAKLSRFNLLAFGSPQAIGHFNHFIRIRSLVQSRDNMSDKVKRIFMAQKNTHKKG